MSCSTSQKISLVAALVALAFGPALFSSNASSSEPVNRAKRFAGRSQSLVLLKRGPLNTDQRTDLDTSREDRQSGSVMAASTARHTRIIQFAGPIKHNWLGAIRASGAKIVGYVPNNAYIIRGSGLELERVAALAGGSAADDARPIRWMGRLSAIDKIDPSFTDEVLSGARVRNVEVEVEVIDSPEVATAIDLISTSAASVNSAPRRFLNFVVLSVTARSDQLLAIAALDEVLFIGPAARLKLHDERSAQIVAGNLVADKTQPSGAGYLAWLASMGLDSPSDFAVDITDSGLDRGFTSSPLHPDFLDWDLNSRVAYSFNYSPDGFKDDQPGHGTIVASIAGGRGVNGHGDVLGYMYGLGIDPSIRLGASRIFDADGRPPFILSFTSVVASAYAAGARISNNSWGSSTNNYDAAAQEYDSLVRDAQPAVPANQEMAIVFSAGNGGPGGRIGSPGTAKNVITVAASENYRPEGLDSCDLDGDGGIGPEGADNALDILRFSSGGPTNDLRAKPDITAPGTHIHGAASLSPGFFGEGLCPGVPVFQPPGQSFYTWSSGTSLAAPHITGAASLLRKFFVSRNLLGNNRAPSPAMIKAHLLNSASYLTGENAGETLPGVRQGWGLVDLSRAFDDAERVLVDQTTLLTESGQKFEIQGSLADRSLPLLVTLAWTDPPGSLVGPALVNDLDLEITDGGVTVYRGNNFAGAYSIPGGEPDTLNNVEAIYLAPAAIAAGLEGNFTITVRAANIPGDGVPGNETSLDQDFALAVYNIATSVPPPPPPPEKMPVITVATFVKKTLTITGTDFTAAAQVEINGRLIERTFEFDGATNSLSIKLKRRKLNLNAEADNQIVLIENGKRSQPFLLRL